MAAIAPPSYDSVTNAFLAKAKDGTNVAAGVADLSPAELAIINSADPPPPYTDDEKKKIYDEVAKILAKDETLINILKESAKTAVKACKRNDEIFNELLTLLLKVDQQNNIKDTDDAFVPRLKALREKYRTIIEDSRTLAARIAVYGTNFDEVVIRMCADTALTTDQRREAIEEALKEAEEFETHSKKIIDDLKDAQDQFNALAVAFSQWAQTKTGAIDSQIAAINTQLTQLSDRLTTLRNTLIGFGVGEGAGMIIAIAGCWAGPFAPICWVAGALVMLGFGVGLVAAGIQFAACKAEIDEKNAKLATLTKDKKDIETARANLVASAAVDAKEFTANIQSIAAVWVAAKADATEIKDWLHRGADKAAMPQYMKIQLEHGMALYSKMSQYLTLYASGLEQADIPKPAAT